MKKDFLIVGQGLAGSLLAWNLLKRNKDILIVDDSHKNCSSLAAAGMINPITGKRLVLSQRCEELLPFAKNVFIEIGKHFNKTFFEEKDIIRLFGTKLELEEWDKKSRQTHLKKYYGKKQESGSYGEAINDKKGSFIIQQGGYCRKLDLLNCLTDYFIEMDILAQKRFDYGDIELKNNAVNWNGIEFDCIIFCEGYQAQDNPWFSWLPFNHAKGEILNIRIDNSNLPDAVISCGKWCIPSKDGSFTVGSTYSWDKFDCNITSAAKTEILDELGKYVSGDFKVEGHMAGVRPIMKDLKPVLGKHPKYSRIAILNGLASKGLLWGPYYSNQMAKFLMSECTLESEVNIGRFLKKHFKES